MLEGPEILIQVNLLKTKCIGKTIIGIENNEKFQKSGVKIHAIVLLPLTIIDIWSRGKVIVFETVDTVIVKPEPELPIVVVAADKISPAT